jgi:tRNA threonylcarbamoyladenosine biosynthesis protein TsaE
MNMEWLSRSEADSAECAAQIASRLEPGHVVALTGDLGAGKTTLVREIVRALGGDPGAVSSPTFALVHEYAAGSLRIAHIDAYRIHGEADALLSGIGETLESADLVFLEWPERIEGLLPPGRLRVHIRADPGGERRITLQVPMQTPK